MPSSYGAFRRRTDKEKSIRYAYSTEFINNSVSSTEVTLVREEVVLNVALTHSFKEGVDEIVLFSHVDEAIVVNNIIIGDYIEHDGRTLLVFEQYYHPTYINYNKFRLIECNIEIGYNNTKLKGSFIGSGSKAKDMNNDVINNIMLQSSQQTPIIIAALDITLTTNDRIMFTGEAWRIVNIDKHTNPGIMYLSIEEDEVNESDDISNSIAIDPVSADDSLLVGEVRTGQTIELATFNGYFTTNYKVEIIERQRTLVKFIIPYGVDILTINTKDSGDNTIITNYQVVS